jgi:hypothetical protein
VVRVLRIALLVLALALSGCSTAHRTATSRRVILFGDSIAYETGIATTTKLRAAYTLTIVIGLGDVETHLVPQIRAIAATKPYAVIIEAGTDDALERVTDWRPAFDHIVSATTHLRCVVFMTVPVIADYYGYHNGPSTRPIRVAHQWNAALAAVIPKHRNFRLVDWNAESISNPSLLARDGIHLLPIGQEWLSAHFQTALTSCS